MSGVTGQGLEFVIILNSGIGNYVMTEQTGEIFSKAVSDRICNHMNKDHADAVLVYAQAFGKMTNATAAEMVSIDAEGMNLSAQVNDGSVPVRVLFNHVLKDAQDAHHTLIDMLKEVRQPG